MSDVRIKLNTAAVRAIMRSPEVQADLEKRARRIASAVGPGEWHIHPEVGKRRARISIVTGDAPTAAANARSHALIRAVEAGRG